ncbi:hypothetical protein ACNKHX_02865 [Shigella flexneri]
MEHSNWRMINLPVRPLSKANRFIAASRLQSIFHLHYINDLMNKLPYDRICHQHPDRLYGAIGGT